MLSEDSYGTLKRLDFIEQAIRGELPLRVLDVGCGIGHVSLELARRYPNTSITAIDTDQTSIDHARSKGHPANLVFLNSAELFSQSSFDLVVASEVLEHVHDYEQFLCWIRERLVENGRVIVTVPNGCGPFELMSLVQGCLQLVGLYKLLRAVRRACARPAAKSFQDPVTLALSPHINFFSYRGLHRTFTRAGFTVSRYRPRTFLCGFVLDKLLQGRRLIAWNASVADRLPAPLNSDWMFLLAKIPPDKRVSPWTPGWYSRIHRYVNERCMRLA